MKSSEEKENGSKDASLAQELDQITEQIESATRELDSCREETSQLRARAASVSVSFESAREELQNILQSESGIQAHSVHSPPPSDEIVDAPLPAGASVDQTVLCGVRGQLEATKVSVQKAREEKNALLQRIEEMEEEVLTPRAASLSSQVYLDIPAISISEKKPLPLATGGGDGNGDGDLIQKLGAQTSSRSSFRDDHARIWRDSTFPNICLLGMDEPNLGATAKAVSCGVVAERVFAGTTAFTSTNADGDVEDQYNLSNCLRPEEISDADYETAKTQYASLVLEDLSVNPDIVKVIAPRPALDKIVRLIENANTKNSLPNSRSATPSLAPMSSKARVGSPKLKKQSVTPALDPVSSRPRAVSPKPKKQSATPKLEPNRNGETIQQSPSKQSRPGPRLSTTSEVFAADHLHFLVGKCVPHRFQECDLQLKYSTDRDGMSVHTLFRLCENISPTIVGLKDTLGRVFGCYAAQPWKSSSMRYYGTGESFVFSCKPVLSAYKWTRGNHFFQFSHGNILAMGGGAGSHFALWVDEDLRTGTTSACSTFANPPLTNNVGDETDRIDFDILSLEVWTIVPRSHHTFDDSGNTG